jgi:NTP pyrophosphatase (non-canonical NTP hydrolase)
MTVVEFQRRIDELYGAKDRGRGLEGTFMWFTEEVGELSRALRRGERAELEAEFADVLAWLCTLASMHGVDVQAAAAAKYAACCP